MRKKKEILNKQFRWNGVILSVQSRSLFGLRCRRTIGKHLKDKHNQRPTNLYEQFATLKKCRRKFDCLIHEMLLIRKIPT